MTPRSPSPLATTLAALVLSCSGMPVEPRGRVGPPVPPATSEESTPRQAPRTYADLGPAHIVPQLGIDDVSQVAISPDGLLGVIGAGMTDLTLQVWDLDRKVVVAELVPPSSLVEATPGFAHGGAFIVLQASGRTAVWDGATGALVGTVEVEDKGSRAAFDYERAEPEALLYDDKARALLLRPIRPGPPIFRVAVAGDPWELAISGDRYVVIEDKEIEVYDRTGKLVEKLPGKAAGTSDGRPVRGTPWSPPVQARPPEQLGLDHGECVKGGSRLLCTVYDREHHRSNVYLADLGAREPKAERLPPRPAAWFEVPESGAGVSLRCAGERYGTSGFPAGSKELADAERLAEVRTDAAKGSEEVRLVTAKGAILAVRDGHLAVWDVASGKKRTDIASDAVFDPAVVAPSPDGTKIAVGGGSEPSGQVRVFDAATGALVRTLEHGHEIRSVLWNPDGAVLVTTAHRSSPGLYLEDADASVKLWSAGTGKLLRTIKGQYDAAYSENNALFVTASYDRVEIYDAHTMKKTTRGGGPFMFASPSPDGKWVLVPRTDTSSIDPGLFEYNGLEVLRAATGAVAQSFARKPGEMHWSTDSTHLLFSTAKSSRDDNMARSFELGLYAIPSGKPEGRWTGPGAVTSARLVLGGKLVVASVRGMLRLSRVSDGASLWIQPVTAGDKCTAVAFDEAGHFDGDDAAVAAGLGVRLGDDLRRSAVVHTGPKVDAQRVRGLYGAFVAGAR